MNRPTPLRGLGLLVLLGTTVGLAGCQGAGAFAQISEKINQISDNQTQILSRLDGLEAKIGEAAKQAPPRGRQGQKGPQPGKPDPKATYKVAVADTDRQKGPKDAKITLVEWSDFQ